MRILVIVLTTMRAFVPQSPVIGTTHLVILGIYVASEIVSLIFHVITIISANNSPDDSPSGADNVCNDYRYCCVYPGPANPDCPVLLAPCAPAVTNETLNINFECTISTAFSPIFIVLSLFIALVAYSMGRGKDLYVEQYIYDDNIPLYTGNKVGGNISSNNDDARKKKKTKSNNNVLTLPFNVNSINNTNLGANKFGKCK